jgi:hypothetical protein
MIYNLQECFTDDLMKEKNDNQKLDRIQCFSKNSSVN